MLSKHVALALGLWTLQASGFAADPSFTTTHNVLPLIQMAIQDEPNHVQVNPMDLGLAMPFQLQVPRDKAYSHPRKEDWLESNLPDQRTAWSESSDQSSSHSDSPKDAGLQKGQ